ncbi:LOW QUALITY PROTEIN: hypothetical protein KUTeg_021465 [Tegillarca granosa]|uniref:DDE Tnp4 domain-containing protein n=1 Tax=Tegillarca granosa TaxID=220873 RepID=A0ABQ9E3C5_TEGGR|nr:LOW QUALITY PROTEIN: hypothetical protein KUTeg_021465 [Tegillarca granosa]
MAKGPATVTCHFVEGIPTEKYPDPLSALLSPHTPYQTPARKLPKRRVLSEPPNKRRKVLFDVTELENSEIVPCSSPSIVDDSVLKANSVSSDTAQDVCPLDLLAIAAENHQLKQQLAQLLLANEESKRKDLDEVESNSTNKKSNIPLSIEILVNSEVKGSFKYYSGFSHERFMNIYNFLVKDETLPFKPSVAVKCIKSMPVKDQLLLTLMKLRQNFDNIHLANLFLFIHRIVIFSNWINFMFFHFGSVSIWPHRDVIIQNMPSKFKCDFPETMIILDGTKMKIQRPTALTTQSQMYSDYKSATTVKGLIGVDPRGSVTFISMLFSGAISDKAISSQSGLFDTMRKMIDCGMLKEGDGVMVDKGFNIREEIEMLGLRLVIPPNAPCEGQMPAADVAMTKKIAAHRVHVERAISRIKKFKILSNRIDLSIFSSINQIWFVCCFLTNFMGLLIRD